MRIDLLDSQLLLSLNLVLCRVEVPSYNACIITRDHEVVKRVAKEAKNPLPKMSLFIRKGAVVIPALHCNLYNITIIEACNTIVPALADAHCCYKPFGESSFFHRFVSVSSHFVKCFDLHFRDGAVWHIPETGPVIELVSRDEVRPVSFPVQRKREICNFSKFFVPFGLELFPACYLVLFLQVSVL